MNVLHVLQVAGYATLAAIGYFTVQVVAGIVLGVYKGVREAVAYRLAVRRMRKMGLAELHKYARRNTPDGG